MVMVLASDATVSDDGAVVGDPTEAALVVLAAKVGVDAELTRRAHPRLAEVPFDSAYKYMATFHERPDSPDKEIVELVKGAPDVVLDLSAQAIWHGSEVDITAAKNDLLAANRELSEQGLRVLALAIRRISADHAHKAPAPFSSHPGTDRTRGTDSSNPALSSGESRENRDSALRRIHVEIAG